MINHKQVIDILLRYFPNLQAVYIFGSQTSDECLAKSDVDIAILLSVKECMPANSIYLYNLRFELGSVLSKDVDLINLRRINTVLQKEIIETGNRIYCSDEFVCDLFETHVYSAYQKLNQERADILNDIIKSGRVLDI